MGEDEQREMMIMPQQENELVEENRLVIDNADDEEDDDDNNNEGEVLVVEEENSDGDGGTVLNLVNAVGGGGENGIERGIRIASSHSASSSISPQPLPVTGASGYSGGGGGRPSSDGTASQSPNTTTGGSGTAIIQDLANSPILNIACGYLTAKLYMDRFYCPGIHQLCIEYNGQFLTPKQFTIVAAKDKQKDWKGAIKINRQPIRVLFERNLLEFYKHNEYCSGRCVSKSYKPLSGDDPATTSSSSTSGGVEFIQQITTTTPSNTATNGSSGMNQQQLIDDPALTLIGGGGRGGSAIDLAAFANGYLVKCEPDDDDDDDLGDDREPDNHHHHNHRDDQTHSRQEQQQQFVIGGGRRRASVGNTTADVVNVFRGANGGIDLTTVHGHSSLANSEPVLYWNCVSQLGLFHELTQEIEQQVQILKTSFGIPEFRAKAAKKLSELVRVLDIGDKIQKKLIAKRTYANAQCALLANEVNELRKIAETQEKKRREAKRKSELLDQLIGNLQDQKRRRRNNEVSSNNNNISPVQTSPADTTLLNNR